MSYRPDKFCLILRSLDTPNGCEIFITLKRRNSREQNIEDDSETPDVAALVVLALQDLRRDVVGRAGPRGHGLLLLSGLRLEDVRKTEVDDLHRALV